ncbi:unnamed protein product [Rotaria sordida]|uniref:Uncharacterized protein n=1 Tax=Rotaria sordida TaxID=392033 RepID=A0A814H0M9_9BILA|nr:unnamed protein product [Rotaria sordida]
MVGIDSRNKHILDAKYICPVCSLILRDPIQLSKCGHRQCQTCLNVKQETIIKCRQCQQETLRIEEHLDQSHSNFKCEYCGERFNSVIKFNLHKIFECQQLIVDCALKDFGCSERIIRIKMKDHYLTQQHQYAILKVVPQMLAQLNDRQMNIDFSQTATAGVCNLATAQLEELYEMLNILIGGVETLTNDEQRLTNETLQMQITLTTLTEELSKIKLSIEESNTLWKGVNLNQDILNQDLSSLEEEINDLQCVSYDGILVWKITKFHEKMIDAQSERQTSIYSPPFYSSPNGYKMRVRLYLNGDGNARHTHMSLFFVLMRGLNDPILKFPFNYKVIFCLYDQTSQQKHIIDSFRPDIKSSSFQRPRSNMNIASGIPKFFPLEMIQQEGNPYVQDDTMFIKIMVDFGDIHKTLLPYAMSLNPGLPMHVQQAMIKQEAERKIQFI